MLVSVEKNHLEKPTCGPTRFLLVRHGETDWNREKRIQGHTDVPLNDTGIEQATAVANYIAGYERDVAAIYSSDLQRARVTAETIARKYNLAVSADACLREGYMGQAQGLLVAEYEERFGATRKTLDESHTDIFVRWNYSEVPDSEPRNSVLKRVHGHMAKIAQIHENKTVVLVTHAGVIRTLILASIAHDRELFQRYCGNIGVRPHRHQIANCAIIEFAYQNQTCVFKKIHEF